MSPTRCSPPTPRPGSGSPATCAGAWSPTARGGWSCAATCTWAWECSPPPAPATSRERLRFSSVKTRIGEITYCEAGVGEPLLALHGLGGTKASFLPTIAALAESHRVIAVDLPGFGDSVKPIGAPYDATVVRGHGGRHDGRAGARHCPPGWKQHGRTGRAGGWAGLPRPDRPDGAAVPRPGLAAQPPVGRARAAAAAGAGAAADGPAAGGGQDRPQPHPGHGRRLGGGGRRRVPARLPDSARPGRLLRGGAQHLPGRAGRGQRLLGPAARPRA